MYYVLGLSYGGVEDALAALGWAGSKSSTYRDVQGAGEAVQRIRCVFRRKRSPNPADGDHPDRLMAIGMAGIGDRHGPEIVIGMGRNQ